MCRSSLNVHGWSAELAKCMMQHVHAAGELTVMTYLRPVLPLPQASHEYLSVEIASLLRLNIHWEKINDENLFEQRQWACPWTGQCKSLLRSMKQTIFRGKLIVVLLVNNYLPFMQRRFRPTLVRVFILDFRSVQLWPTFFWEMTLGQLGLVPFSQWLGAKSQRNGTVYNHVSHGPILETILSRPIPKGILQVWDSVQQ
jgi:hypothetical protein